MNEVAPGLDLIHKFYPPTEYSIDALLNRYFWFSKREYLNDPFDLGNFRKGRQFLNMQKFIQLLVSLYEYKDLAPQQILSMLPEYASCSFTGSPFNKQMWAYYAKDYSGWCLSFRRGQVVGRNKARLMPVIYVDDLLQANATIQDQLYGDSPREQFLMKVLCTKHESWQHEDEERMVLQMKSETNGVARKWGSFELQSITMGNKISDAYRNILTTIAKLHNVNLYEIELSTKDFNLTSKSIPL